MNLSKAKRATWGLHSIKARLVCLLPVEPPGPELQALLDTPNLLVSPHMGWSSRQARRGLVQTLAGHLQAYVSAEARHSQRRMNNP